MDTGIDEESTKLFFGIEVPIPGPRPLPILGNILDIDLVSPLDSLIGLVRKYGPIFSLTFAGTREITVSSRELVNEVSDESRFCKIVTSGVETMRAAAGDGLFTAQHNNHTWGVAHRILMPVFGPLKIRSMFDDMNDLSEQLCLKWARHCHSAPIEVADDFTRLTLDTISLCAMDYRFNSFYLDKKAHPFVESMVEVLAEADLQAVLPDVFSLLRPRAMSKFRNNIEQMQATCREIIAQRRQANGKKMPNDLLDAMLNGKDPETGDSLSEEAIVHNIITFLVAGHETTSGLLSFAIYYLVEHPQELKRAREEVDRVVGHGPINVDHLQQLPFLDSVFRETLRLMPTAPGYYVTPFKDEIIGGKYLVKPGEALCVLLHTLHRDPKVWGSDAEDFRPDRMRNLENIPQNAWKPFGNGMRGCIGRAFAWQEAQLVISMILRNFDLSKGDPNYKLKVKHLLTIKPANFKVRVSLRNDKRPTDFLKSLKTIPEPIPKPIANPTVISPSFLDPITILFGSDAGTCEAVAQRIAIEAGAKGYSPMVLPMNDAVDQLPQNQPVILVSASYNGLPSRNAAKFVPWVQGLKPGDLQHLKYAVFGCGHRDWPATLFKVPRSLDSILETAGGQRLCTLGVADTAATDVFFEVEKWLANDLWPTLLGYPATRATRPKSDIDVKLTLEDPPRISLRSGFVAATVKDSRALSAEGVPAKRHLELELPPGTAYEAGGHVHILPVNNAQLVRRALSYFRLSGDVVLTMKSESGRPLPVPSNTPVTAWDLFASYVELTGPATPGNIQVMSELAVSDETRRVLEAMSTSLLGSEPRNRALSVLELLESFPDLNLPLSEFLIMLPQMRPRTYSFSSSPAWQSNSVTLTYTVEKKGVASNYLASLRSGSVLFVSNLPSTPHFCLPSAATQATTPVIMIAAGAGLAPFRGFIQDRAISLRSGATLAPALLFFGCHGQLLDDMYRDELDGFEAENAVKVFRAFSRDGDMSCKHVTDQLRDHLGEVSALWEAGANFYVCGGKKISDSVFDVLAPALFKNEKTTAAEAGAAGNVQKSFGMAPKGRYVVEVFN
ncbi:Bifunctional cytochrome P450/NADPH--P450 reductase [Colletotrichum scovillei]|uniref:Bifunctional cytochrome P450/NADPH--P450 reductase n=1 Tax=Colletotrichum scovillei TaxID=1209932 RepID=A0A9P7UI16_9PEZI|nr:Bifunctional cytochrome P450/NADPH--P450 reductase [Colletotrichum scovillei]KAG7082947.1 Bifunctional cytochrome P450/NADPH--P450 reductase [Colletotrichum scovillei]